MSAAILDYLRIDTVEVRNAFRSTGRTPSRKWLISDAKHSCCGLCAVWLARHRDAAYQGLTPPGLSSLVITGLRLTASYANGFMAGWDDTSGFTRKTFDQSEQYQCGYADGRKAALLLIS